MIASASSTSARLKSENFALRCRHSLFSCRGVEYLALLVGVWVYMVAPNLYAATISVSPFGHGACWHEVALFVSLPVSISCFVFQFATAHHFQIETSRRGS